MALGEYLGAGSGVTKGLYHLNGDATDSSGNGFNGTANNITWVGGKVGSGCGSFNGTTSYINGTGINIASSDFTISCWFNVTSGTTIMECFTVGDVGPVTYKAVIVRVRKDTNKLSFSLYGNDWEVSKTVTNGQWYNFGGTFKTSTLGGIMYLDGEQIGTNTFTGAFTGGTTWNIGKSHWVSGQYFNGKIDEVIVENRIRTPAEWKKYYTYSKGRFANL